MRRRPNVDSDQPLPPGGTVTAIVASPRAPGRFTLIVDDKPAHTLGINEIDCLGIFVGATTFGREAIIAREEAILRTYDRAVTMLAAHGRAAKDLERRLVREGQPVEFARLAVERLSSEGFVDDMSFAKSFIRSKLFGAGFARQRLQAELRRSGVSRIIVDDAIAEVFAQDGVDELIAATALATRRMRMTAGGDDLATRRRVYGLLARRGFQRSVISAAIAEATRKTLDERA